MALPDRGAGSFNMANLLKTFKLMHLDWTTAAKVAKTESSKYTFGRSGPIPLGSKMI